jgi:hypothetical protein
MTMPSIAPRTEPATHEPAPGLDQAGPADLHILDLAVGHLSEHLGLAACRHHQPVI